MALCRESVTEAAIEVIRRAETTLPEDVRRALEKALETEKEDIPKAQLKNILDNVSCAKSGSIPICQDTGLPVFYVGVGSCLDMDLSIIEESLKEAVRKATVEVPLRPNAVHPVSRENPGDNTGPGVPIVDISILPGKDFLEITVLPKGAGSENMSALCMLNPSEGAGGIERFVLGTVANAGGNPCPPIILGLGIGGTADSAMKLAKKSLLREIGSRNGDPSIAGLEASLLEKINRLGIGPMGLGGNVTCLGVNAEYSYCHTASLPVAVNIQCWAGRKATARIYPDRIDYL